MNNIGIVCKLNKEEHVLTRPLWERIFTEDSKEFLDYYYSVKVRDNEIYAIKDGQDIVAMLHLNPYQMRIGNEIYDTHYIVAVATDERYRRQGLMAKLMNHVLKVMTDRGEPFTFLMPANEVYYKSFGFQTILNRKETFVSGTDAESQQIEFSKACVPDCKEMADFANKYLEKFDIATYRTEKYYRTLLAEHVCEGGGILLLKENEKIVGIVPYFGEKANEIKGAMVQDEKYLQQAAYYLTGDGETTVTYKQFPFMINVLQPERKLLFENANVFLDEVV